MVPAVPRACRETGVTSSDLLGRLDRPMDTIVKKIRLLSRLFVCASLFSVPTTGSALLVDIVLELPTTGGAVQSPICNRDLSSTRVKKKEAEEEKGANWKHVLF